MKKLVFVSLMLLFCCCGSKEQQTGRPIPSTDEVYGELPIKYTYDYDLSRMFDLESGKVQRIMKFEFNGHSYIQFVVKPFSSSDYPAYCIVEDPDCPCHHKDTIQ